VSTNFSGTTAGRLRLFVVIVGLGVAGCRHTPIDLSQGPAPLREPRPGGAETFEDSLTGGELFAMYCNQCHNARALGERPFINYQNAMAHMRVRANLTGEEYEKLMAFLERWHDIPSPTPPVEPSPKRLTFGQPVAELREEIAPPENPAAGGPPAAAGAPPPAAAIEPLPLPLEPLPQPVRPAGGS
jgi:hypothetical protein